MEKYHGSCHCGKVQFEVKGDFKNVVTCNCSICQRKGSILAFVSEENFKLLSGGEYLTDYQFGKKTIHHTFCSVCGVTAFSTGEKTGSSKMKAVNVRCLEGFDLKNVNIKEFDGKSL